MDQGAAGEREERLGGLAFGAGMAVKAVLVNGVADALGEIGLQLGGGDGDAVEEEDEVEAVLVVLGIVDLAHHPETVGGVAGEDVGIDGQGGLELGHQQGLLEAEQLDAVAEHIEGAALVELVAQAGQENFAGLGAVVLGQDFPGVRLGGLHPGEDIGREERPRPVVAGGVALGIEPAVSGEVLADLGLEGDFFMGGH